ncbi:hypothetical protein ACVV4E_03990 [Escherichia coli]
MEARTIPVTLFIHYATSTFSHEKLLVATVDMSKIFQTGTSFWKAAKLKLPLTSPSQSTSSVYRSSNCVNKNRKQSPTPNSVLLLSMTKSSSYFASNTRQIPMSSPTKNH